MSASSGAAATGEGVVTALVSAAGAVLNSAAQAVSDGFRSLAANYGSGSEEEEEAAAAAAAAEEEEGGGGGVEDTISHPPKLFRGGGGGDSER